MRFSHKLKKLTTGDALQSARHHVRRFLLGRRWPTRPEPAAIMETIDRDKFEQIRARHGVKRPGPDAPKYLDWQTWIEANVRRIRNLELDLGRRRRVLDIGSGSGYFLYLCKLLGHDPVGLDIDTTPLFREMIDLLGVERIVWQIRPFVPLPDLGPKFDLVTAHMICFNDHKHPGLWGEPEWEFFLNDLATHLNPNGRVWLELNREYDGTFYTPELKAFFERRGARIVGQRVVFSRGLRAPAATAPAAR